MDQLRYLEQRAKHEAHSKMVAAGQVTDFADDAGKSVYVYVSRFSCLLHYRQVSRLVDLRNPLRRYRWRFLLLRKVCCRRSFWLLVVHLNGNDDYNCLVAATVEKTEAPPAEAQPAAAAPAPAAARAPTPGQPPVVQQPPPQPQVAPAPPPVQPPPAPQPTYPPGPPPTQQPGYPPPQVYPPQGYAQQPQPQGGYQGYPPQQGRI